MKKFYTQKVIINKAQNGKRLDIALTKLLNTYTRSQIKIFLQNKYVIKNDKIFTDTSYKVKKDEEYFIKIPQLVIPKYESENIPLKIIFEDKDLIIVNKDPGMVTHPAPGNQTGTLVQALLNHTKNNLSSVNEENRPGIVHRLDKDTSGLLVVAKNNTSHLNLAYQFKEHSISRKYFAIVWGMPDNQIIKGYIERHKVNRKKMSFNKKNRGKYSETKINLKKYYKICSLVECILKTGRTHQVRLHLTSIDAPIVGDKIYGKNKVNSFSKDKENYNRFLILKNFQRQALHAYHIGFNHPTTGKYMEFESELPEDMKYLLDFLVKY
tara:strand:- start:358 stop:1329 length:972 start_codon:yes stop_codon:yes gene_type:complete